MSFFNKMFNRKYRKETYGKIIVLILLFVMIFSSIDFNNLPFMKADVGGTGGSSTGTIVTNGYITSHAYGTKVSFIIKETDDPKWFVQGGVVEGGNSMPVSMAGTTSRQTGGGGSVVGRFPIYILGGTATGNNAKEIIKAGLARSPDIDFAEISSLRYNGSASLTRPEQISVAGQLRSVMGLNWWSNANASGEQIKTSFGLKSGVELVNARDTGNEQAFLSAAASNIYFTSTLLNIAKQLGHNDQDLIDAIAIYDIMMDKLEKGSSTVTPPSRNLEVVVLLEQMVGFGLGGDIYVTNMRTYETTLMNGSHGFSNSKEAIDNRIVGNDYTGYWVKDSIQDLTGVSWGGNWRNQAPDGTRFVNQKLFYDGPLAVDGRIATEADARWGFGVVYVPSLTGSVTLPYAVTLVKVHEYGTKVNGVFVADDALTHHEIIPIMDNKTQPPFADSWRNPEENNWYNPNSWRPIPKADPSVLISRKDPIVGAGPAEKAKNKAGADENADFATEDLREWWVTTNTAGVDGYHSKRGTADPEVTQKWHNKNPHICLLMERVFLLC